MWVCEYLNIQDITETEMLLGWLPCSSLETSPGTNDHGSHPGDFSVYVYKISNTRQVGYDSIISDIRDNHRHTYPYLHAILTYRVFTANTPIKHADNEFSPTKYYIAILRSNSITVSNIRICFLAGFIGGYCSIINLAVIVYLHTASIMIYSVSFQLFMNELFGRVSGYRWVFQ